MFFVNRDTKSVWGAIALWDVWMCDRFLGMLGVRSLFGVLGKCDRCLGDVEGAIAVLRFEEVRSLCRDVEGVR
ncbi:hypothetical protein [Sphaerospermopsis sp. FACHB-1194]|uniref:hypothetical protein n=1 Tax=Sphaerospermopsis sp. FACHB-1194 TaxID=2692862 RepID=UPI00167FFA3A|nr:hypothetical protein [Sphaerospermopsis sp. FACHB-1194]MBD2145234.1 hypothetical protein [Sphaerospermopsis sp. FACHB-1194]